MKILNQMILKLSASVTLPVMVLCGFARAQTSTYLSFAPAGAERTFPGSINERGEIAGLYYDAKAAMHGFFRSSGGSVFLVDPPGSKGTVARGVDATGNISGYYQDQADSYHSFVRKRDGQYVSFDATSE